MPSGSEGMLLAVSYPAVLIEASDATHDESALQTPVAVSPIPLQSPAAFLAPAHGIPIFSRKNPRSCQLVLPSVAMY